jgi:predicted dienelactone hydrolase
VATALALVVLAPAAARAGDRPRSPGVARTTLALVDRSRTTAAQGGAAEQDSRTLVTVVSHPRRQRGPLPLVVFATGFGGTATNYAPVYDDWVRAGYVVASPEFPLSGDHAPGGPSAGDLANQPGDLAFIIRELVARSERKGELRDLIDTDRIAIAGKSLGALTVFAAGYDPDQRIPDLRAVIAMTGAPTDDGTYFHGIDTPLLLLHGDADTTVPIQGSRDAFAKAEGPVIFVTLLGQTHGSAFEGDDSPAAEVVDKTSVDFLDRYVKGKPRALDRLLADADVPGVSTVESRE